MPDGSGYHKCFQCDSLFRPSSHTASGMGMPNDGSMSGAPTAPASDTTTTTNVPQQVVMPPSGLPLIDPNQVTTKPRQTPSDGGGDGFDPKANGSEGGPDSPLSPEPSDDGGADSDGGSDDAAAPKMSARRQHAVAMKISAMASQIRQDKPGIQLHLARKMARQIIEAFPMVVQADLATNPLDFGNRDKVKDGPLTDYLKNGPIGQQKKKPGEPGTSEAPGAPSGPTPPGDELRESHPGASQHLPSSVTDLAERAARGVAPAAETGEAASLARVLPLLAF